ncbi:hypothetical protein BDZ45DRAFT_694807 [Acephala macrosclerotiorum]|nr:hypothetical protein BDZ45DRAFT_694807 [Acephala macrosclerotiorum]
MDVRWTPLSQFPSRLYRVFYPYQATQSHSETGLAAPNRRVAYFQDDIPGFVASLVSHRRQKREPSPYISFFEDLREAQMWCLAAEDTFGESCYIVALDLISPAFQQGLVGGTIHGFRLGDVVAKLALKEPALGAPTGRERVDSEWMFVYRLPAETFLATPQTSRVIRQMLDFPETPKPITCRCECEEARQGKLHLCEEPLVGAEGEGRLSCGCRSENLCIHFDWTLDDQA